jgi:FRG domain
MSTSVLTLARCAHVLDRVTTYEVLSLSGRSRSPRDFKRDGKYDWFRGQTHEWPLCPTRNQLDEEGRNDALVRPANFAYQLRLQPERGSLDACDEKELAVAQHYGIPTHRLDFTTDPEVAGFFATHGRGSATPPNGYILCLSTTELLLFWENAFPDLLPLKTTGVNVPDLWRLHDAMRFAVRDLDGSRTRSWRAAIQELLTSGEEDRATGLAMEVASPASHQIRA